MSDTLPPHGLYSPWDSSGQNTGVGSLSLLEGIFPTQASNPGLRRGANRWGASPAVLLVPWANHFASLNLRVFCFLTRTVRAALPASRRGRGELRGGPGLHGVHLPASSPPQPCRPGPGAQGECVSGNGGDKQDRSVWGLSPPPQPRIQASGDHLGET